MSERRPSQSGVSRRELMKGAAAAGLGIAGAGLLTASRAGAAEPRRSII